ncbi:WSD1 [Symbiodinium natans]|uniref:WSD1 protein n=1 Tax=Symbiodinium natans TaxID=878477 RepID=A0A812S0B2_9DINO|nr:WSD1 [Symbiodinium natans]
MTRIHRTRGISDTFGATVWDKATSDVLNRGVLIVPFLWFKDPLDVAQVRQQLLQKLLPIMRFRSKIVPVKDMLSTATAFQELDQATLEAALPELVTAVDDVKNRADLDSFVSAMYNQPWEPELPLWRAYVINNFDDGRSLLVMNINHTIGDGVALLDVLDAIIDGDADGNPISPKKSVSRMPVPASCMEGCVMQMKGLWRAFYGPFIKDQLPGDPRNKLKSKDGRRPGKAKAVFSTSPVPLQEVKAIKNQLPGATINDILMTLTDLTLREYFLRYEPAALRQQVRANMPISMRREDDHDVYNPELFGNRFSQGHLYFPLHIEDPLEVMRQMKAQIDVIKISPEPIVRDKIVKFITTQSCFPPSLTAKLLLDAFGKVTVMLSNVVGPTGEVQFLGQTLDDMTFFAMAPLGLYFGIVQYKGEIKVGICVDAAVEAEPKRLGECWEEAYRKLKAAVLNR